MPFFSEQEYWRYGILVFGGIFALANYLHTRSLLGYRAKILSTRLGLPEELDYASMLTRGGGKIIDLIILITAKFLFSFGFELIGGASSINAMGNDQLITPSTVDILFLPVTLLYGIYCLAKFGATPGKMLVGTRVVMANGALIGWGAASKRTFAEILSGFLLIGYFVAIFNKQNRTLHDIIAKSSVINA